MTVVLGLGGQLGTKDYLLYDADGIPLRRYHSFCFIRHARQAELFNTHTYWSELVALQVASVNSKAHVMDGQLLPPQAGRSIEADWKRGWMDG